MSALKLLIDLANPASNRPSVEYIERLRKTGEAAKAELVELEHEVALHLGHIRNLVGQSDELHNLKERRVCARCDTICTRCGTYET